MKAILKYLLVLSVFLSCYFKNEAYGITSAHTNTKSISLCDIDTMYGNQKNFEVFLATSTTATNNDQVPLWLRSMQNGSIPLKGLSASLFSAAYKNYNPKRQHKLLDWGTGINIKGNTGQESDLLIIEAYAKARFSIFQVSAGRTKDVVGLVDSTLSTGAFSISGNALGIPKIEIGTHGYWNLPFTNRMIALKANLTHGWVGDRINTYNKKSGKVEKYKTYLHQKTLYGRIGKPHWRINLYGGFNHTVMWGNEQKMFENFGLSEQETFWHVFYGKDYGGEGIHSTKIGNHLGSIDQAMEITLKQIHFFAYHQFYYEAGALAKLANIKDGTWGLSVKNLSQRRNSLYWNKILIEFVYSKSQGGEIGGPVRPSAFEDYYNNSYYDEGWVNNEENIGNILFTTIKYIKKDLPLPNSQAFANNRLAAFHSAFECSLNKWDVITKLTFSKNFGHYFTSPVHRGFGSQIKYHSPPYFGRVNQFNGYIEAIRALKNGWELNMAFAIDQGELLYNSIGGELKITKRW